jgi:hypothetical protein
MTQAATNNAGTFAPLRQKVFAVLWVATIIGNTGSSRLEQLVNS